MIKERTYMKSLRSLGRKGISFAAITALILGGSLIAGSHAIAATNTTLIIDSEFNHKTIDPGREFESGGNMLVRAMYSTLMTFKGGDAGTPIPDIALSYSGNADSTVFTYKLRKNAKFSDGTPVTSKDVVFSLMRLKNLKGNPSSLMDGITATAPDAYTVVLTSNVPNTAIPVIVCSPSLGIVNSALVTKNGGYSTVGADTKDKAEAFLNSASAGSGPYILSKFSLTTEVVLVSNPKYWGPKPKYTKVIFRNVKQEVQRLNVMSGASNIAVDLSPAQAEGMTGVNVIEGVSTTVWFLYSNNNPAVSKVTSDANFQEAVRYGLNYADLVKFAGRGATQAAGIIPSAFQGALKASDATVRDLARAKAALAKSTYANEEIGLRYWGGGAWEGISFDSFAQKIASQLGEVGIKIKLLPTPVGQALTTYRDGSDTMGLWFWGPDWPDSSNYSQNFAPGLKVGLRAGWLAGANPTVTDIVNKVALESNAAKRATLYRNFQLELNKKSPLMPLLQSPAILVSTSGVKGLAVNPIWKINVAELS